MYFLVVNFTLVDLLLYVSEMQERKEFFFYTYKNIITISNIIMKCNKSNICNIINIINKTKIITIVNILNITKKILITIISISPFSPKSSSMWAQ